MFVGINSNSEQKGTELDSESSKDIDAAFTSFVDDVRAILSKGNFSKIKKECLESLDKFCGMLLSVEVKKQVGNSKNVSDLFSVLSGYKQYWNWINIRILEKMTGNSSTGRWLTEKYKRKVFSRKVKDVISKIPKLEIPLDKYTQVIEKWNKDFDNLMIKDIVEHWNQIEKKFNVSETMLFESITVGYVEVCWLLRNDLVEHVLYLATPELFPEVLYLKIGNTVIKDNIASMQIIHQYTL